MQDWTLKQSEWEAWRDNYLKGVRQQCKPCGTMSFATLRPIARVATYECGHVMGLPSEVNP